MGIVLGVLSGVGATIGAAVINAGLELGLLSPILGAPLFDLGSLYLYSAIETSVYFGTETLVSYEILGVTLTTTGYLTAAAVTTAVVGGIIGGSVAGGLSNKTDSLGTGSDIYLEPTVQDYLNDCSNNLSDLIKNDFNNNGVRGKLRKCGVKKVRVVSRKKRHSSVQSTSSESLSEGMEQQFSCGQSRPAKSRKVAVKTRRLRKKSGKR